MSFLLFFLLFRRGKPQEQKAVFLYLFPGGSAKTIGGTPAFFFFLKTFLAVYSGSDGASIVSYNKTTRNSSFFRLLLYKHLEKPKYFPTIPNLGNGDFFRRLFPYLRQLRKKHCQKPFLAPYEATGGLPLSDHQGNFT